MCCSTRNRLIWNLGKFRSGDQDHSITDEIYDRIAEVFGVQAAVPLICACSPDKIMMIISTDSDSNYNTDALSPHQLLTVWRKCPIVRSNWPKIRFGRRTAHTAVEKMINASDAPLSLQRMADGFCHIPFSQRFGRKMVRKYFDLIIMKDPIKFQYLVPTMGTNLPRQKLAKFCTAILQTRFTKNSIPYTILSTCEKLKPRELWTAIREGFVHLGRETDPTGGYLFANETFWKKNKQIVANLPEDVRIRVADGMLKSDCREKWEWVQILPLDRSIPMLKRMLQSDVQNRGEISSSIIASCVINNDMNMLITQISSLTQYLSAPRILPCRNEIRAIIESVPEAQFKPFAILVAQHGHQLHDHLTDIVLKRLIRTATTSEDVDAYLSNRQSSTNVPMLKSHLREYFVSRVEADDRNNSWVMDPLLKSITSWNKQNDSVRFPVENYPKVFSNLMADPSIYDFCEYRFPFLFNRYNRCPVEWIIKSFKSRPEPVAASRVFSLSELTSEDIDQICSAIVRDRNKIYRGCLQRMKRRTLLHDIRNPLASAIIKVIHCESQNSCRDLVRMLSLSTTPEQFFSATDRYLPPPVPIPGVVEEKAEVSIEEWSCSVRGNARINNRRDALYSGIAMAFKDIEPADLTISRLDRYCVNGNLMLFARDALASVTCRIPVEKVMPFLTTVVTRPISVSKHAMRAIELVLDVETKIEVLSRMVATQTHPTSKTVMAKILLQSVPLDRNWEIVKSLLSSIRAIDSDTIGVLKNVEIQENHRYEFCQILMASRKIFSGTKNDSNFRWWGGSAIEDFARFCAPSFLEQVLQDSLLIPLQERNFAEDFSVESHQAINIAIDFVRSTKEKNGCRSVGMVCLDRLLGERVTMDNLIDMTSGEVKSHAQFTYLCGVLCDRLKRKSDETSEALSEILDLCTVHLSRFPRSLFLSTWWEIELCSTIVKMRGSSDFVIGEAIGRWISAVFDADSLIAVHCFRPFLITYFRRERRAISESQRQLCDGMISAFMEKTPLDQVDSDVESDNTTQIKLSNSNDVKTYFLWCIILNSFSDITDPCGSPILYLNCNPLHPSIREVCAINTSESY